MIDILVAAVVVLIGFGALRLALYELNLYRREKRDKLIREQVEAARRRRPIPTAPLIDRRRGGRMYAGGAWVDPHEPTVINLHDRRGQR
jgi:hypothetical protein